MLQALKHFWDTLLQSDILLKSVSVDVAESLGYLGESHLGVSIVQHCLHISRLLRQRTFHLVKFQKHLLEFAGLL